MITSRRSFITGLVSFAVAAPAIVSIGNIMPVKMMLTDISNDIKAWFSSDDPIAIDRARQNILFAASYDSRAATMRDLITRGEVHGSGPRREIISSITIERPEYFMTMSRPEDYSPTAWPERMNTMRAGILRNV